MTKTIKSHYKGAFNEAICLVVIAVINFTVGLLAIRFWGNVGAGVLLILGGFGIYQIIWGFWVLLVEQNRIERKVNDFDKSKETFVHSEIKIIEQEIAQTDMTKNYKLISFLFGLLCLFMGAFGGWNELLLGIGAGLALQSAIMLIIGLLSNYRASFYLIRLQKYRA